VNNSVIIYFFVCVNKDELMPYLSTGRKGIGIDDLQVTLVG
jgi:hypothetical protein